jgi:hypothetical protein
MALAPPSASTFEGAWFLSRTQEADHGWMLM